MDNKQKYKDAAKRIFPDFSSVYKKSENMWRLGSAFDTAIDYFEIIEPAGSKEFGVYALSTLDKFQGHWYDDYGWWGLAALRAAERPHFFPNYDGFLDLAWKCWNFFSVGDSKGLKVMCADRVRMGGAPQVWKTASEGDQHERYAALKPRHEGGVWNCDWRWFKEKDECYCVPIWRQAKDGLGGMQNTVTNALYLAFAARLVEESARADIQRQAHNEYKFLREWFTDRDVDEHFRLLESVDSGGVFARERISAYADGTEVEAYRSELAWAGDQGLMIAALIDYARIVNDNAERTAIKQTAHDIIVGAQTYLADEKGLLRPWWDPYNPDAPGGNPENYETGPSIYMRLLLHAYNRDPSTKSLVLDKCQDFLRRNADAACELPASQDEPAPEAELTALTNRLATLVAASVMLDS